jgi:hypothetical protein
MSTIKIVAISLSTSAIMSASCCALLADNPDKLSRKLERLDIIDKDGNVQGSLFSDGEAGMAIEISSPNNNSTFTVRPDHHGNYNLQISDARNRDFVALGLTQNGPCIRLGRHGSSRAEWISIERDEDNQFVIRSTDRMLASIKYDGDSKEPIMVMFSNQLKPYRNSKD